MIGSRRGETIDAAGSPGTREGDRDRGELQSALRSPSAPSPSGDRGALVRVLGSPAFLGAVLVLATALRLWHVLELRGLPLFERLIIDSEFYDAWARDIASGDWLSAALGGPFYMDPLYSYFLAVVYRVLGRDLLVVRLIQVAFGVATCGLIAILGRKLRDAAAGNLGALLYAVYGPAIFQDGEFEKTALGVLLATGALVLFLRPTTRARLATGIVLGLAALTRGNVLLLAPLAIGFLCWRRAWRHAIALTVGLAIAIAPACIRNGYVSGEWFPTTSAAGQVLYTGNDPWNTVGAYPILPFLRGQTAHEEGDFANEAQRRSGRTLTPAEVSSFWMHETLGHVARSPGFAAAMLARKTALFWSDVEVPDAWDMNFIRRFSDPLQLPLATFGVVSALALLGAFAVRRTVEGRVVLAYVAVYSASVALFFVFSRYRLHAVPPLAALAGVGVLWAIDSARRRAFGTVAAALAAAAALLAFSALAFPSMRGVAVQNFVTLAEIYGERRDFDAARRVLEGAPEAPLTLCAFGRLGVRSGDAGAAVEYLARCLQANPMAPDGWYWLGLALDASGEPEKAREAYRQQLFFIPGHEGALERLRAQ